MPQAIDAYDWAAPNSTKDVAVRTTSNTITDVGNPDAHLGRRNGRFAAVAVRGLVAVGLAVGVVYHLFGFPGLRSLGTYYRIDVDVYRLGGAAFANGFDLYGQMPPTELGDTLPFTYPPLAAVAFSPMSALSLQWVGIITTALSLAALFGTVVLTLASIGIRPRTTLMWSAAGVLAVGLIVEPVYSTLNYGQINILLMAFVAADCLPTKTPWPRGLLLGLVAAIKLTPAVFILFFLLRKDFRAAVVSGVSFAVFTVVGFLAAWSDSTQYWTDTLLDSTRIGKPAYPANQSITGVLARLGLDPSLRTPLWLLLSLAVLVIAVVAMRRALSTGATALALGVNAVLGLLVSPVSWSHHWVWVVPVIAVLSVTAYRQTTADRQTRWGRDGAVLGALAVTGVAVCLLAPHWRLGRGRWSGLGWPLWDQVLASSYVWWGLAFLIVAATTRPGACRAH